MHACSRLVWLFCATLFASAPVRALQPADLRCEYRINPLGIDNLNPRLSWILESKGRSARGERQTACQVLVASTRQKLRAGAGDLWDSGRMETSASILVEYKGKPLESGQQCFWKVRVWDQEGRPSAWSNEGRWTMGLLTPGDWKARWIGYDERESTSLFTNGTWIWFPEGSPEKTASPGTAWFRRSFDLPQDRIVTSAKLFVTGDDRADIYVNGKKLGSVGSFRSVNMYEIGGLLTAQHNVLAMAVENGGSGPNPAGLIGMLRIDFESGDPAIILTDTRWRTTIEEFDDWETQPFDDSTWLAARELGPAGMAPWGEISMPDERRLPARYLRKEFFIEKPVARAQVWYSGLGLSELHVNGKRSDDAVLSPALTEYDKRVFYVTRDVTDLLRIGQNAVGVVLGNGRFYAPRGRTPADTRTYGFPKLLLQMQLEYTDGTSDCVASDESWDLSMDGPIRANNEYDGEEYDARLEFSGWDQPNFSSSKWMRGQMVSPPGGSLCAQPIEPIRVIETLKPVAVKEVSAGVHVFDMGQNMVGWCRLHVSGPAGATVRLRHAETVNPDGTLYLDNIRGAKVTDTYVLKGKGRETYEPRFTYHGFRFVEVSGFPGKPTLASIEGRVVHDDLERTGQFACSNPLVNQIYSNIVWGFRGNYRSIPTDCPQRDERQGWLGDRSEVCRGESYVHNIAPLYSKWLRDMADAQKENGSVPDVCPSYWPIYNDNVTWPSSIAIIPGTLLEQFGDLGPASETYGPAKKWLYHMTTYLTNGLIRRDNYGDWCVPPEDPKLIHSKDPARATDSNLLASAYLYHDTLLLRRYARLLQNEEDLESLDQLATELKEAINKKLLDSEEGYYVNGSQTACVLPLAFGLAPEELREKIVERLVTKIADESNYHIGTGLIGAQWLMRTLTRNGQGDLAWRIATQETYPSWGYMVRKGATTIWELWNGDTADPAMNSGNHVMLVGDLVTWMFEDLAGIRPDPERPGFARILMRPEMPAGLDWVRASHRSPYGTIRSEWSRRNGKFLWHIQVPPNTTALLEIPTGSPDFLTESGQRLQKVAGVKPVRWEAGRQLVEVQSGSYSFETNPYPQSARN